MKAPLLKTLEQCRTVYFCGLVKNAGKTIALRQAMREARRAGVRVAVTSVGRDGEAFDAIYSDFAKPLLDFEPGDLVVTSEGLLPSDDSVAALRRFSIHSPIGSIVAAKVNRPCTFEVAGPSTIAGLRTAQTWLSAHGAELFLIDGALDRKAASMPDLCDGIVVSSGAAVSDDMELVLSQTRSAIDMLHLDNDQPEDGDLRLTFSPIFDSEEELGAVIANGKEKNIVIEVQGAVTERMIRYLMREQLFDRCRVVADCFAKVFINRQRWVDYKRMGLNLSYRRQVRVLSLTVNPVPPFGPSFEAAEFLTAMRGRIPELPVFDLFMADYSHGLVQ